MVKYLYNDLARVNDTIYENLMMAIVNNVKESFLENPDYDFPQIRTESLLESDIERLTKLASVFGSFKFERLFEAAKSVNPIGLVYNDFITCKEKVESHYNTIIENMKESIKAAVTEECDGILGNYDPFIKTLVDPAFANTIGASKSSSDNICFIKENTHSVTREDISNAISVIENCADSARELISIAEKKCCETKEKLTIISNDMDKCVKTVHGVGKSTVKEAIVAACYHEMYDMVNHAHIVQLENQLIESVKQSYKVLAMAANHNPRDLKDSSIRTESVCFIAEQEFDSVIEEAIGMNISEFLMEGSVKNAFDQFKAKITLSNERFLKKHKEAALKSKCDGITIEKWYIPKDINAIHNKVIAEVKKEMDPETKDVRELKAKWKDISGTFLLGGVDSKGVAISAKMLDGKQAALIKDLAHNVQRDHKVTPSDVKEAVKFLENSDAEITKAYNEYMKRSMGSSYALWNPKVLGRTKGERYVKKINTFMQMVQDNIDLNYQKMLLSQLKVKQHQSRVIVLKAARVSSNEAASILESEMNILDEYFTYYENSIDDTFNKYSYDE